MTINNIPCHMLRREIHNTVQRILHMPANETRQHMQALLAQLLEEAEKRNLH